MRCFLNCPHFCDWCQPLPQLAPYLDKLSFQKLVSDIYRKVNFYVGGKNGWILPDVKTANFDFQMINASGIDSTLEDICCAAIPDNIYSTLEDICCAAIPDNISDKGLDRLGGTRVITKSVFIRYNLGRSIYTIPVNQELIVCVTVKVWCK